MQCAAAAPFVSAFHDGLAVPPEAIRHISECPLCQAQLRDSAVIAADLRLTAAADRLSPLPALDLPAEASAVEPRRTSWLQVGWTKPLHVPRIAAALVTVALVVSSLGWFRAQSAGRIETEFHYQITITCTDAQGGVTSSAGSGMMLVGSRTTMYSSDPCQREGHGVFAVIHPVRVRDGIVHLRMKAWRAPAGAAPAAPTVSDDELVDYEYVQGRTVDLAVAGGPTMRFTATIRPRLQANQDRAPIATLLPAANELSILMPALIRDRSVVVSMNAGTSIKADGVIGLYAPGSGLFVFGLQRFEGATEALAGGSVVSFESQQQKYLLYTSLPVTGGAQPRPMWVRHLPDYRPSARGAAGGDDLPGLRSGTLEGVLR
jgi:hypothetical protein